MLGLPPNFYDYAILCRGFHPSQLVIAGILSSTAEKLQENPHQKLALIWQDPNLIELTSSSKHGLFLGTQRQDFWTCRDLQETILL